MNLIRTGRILNWFVSDLRMIAKHPDVAVKRLPLQADPYRPPGLWCFTNPAPDRPALWCFPQPLHPLEVVASLRGMDGSPMALAALRAQPWMVYTEAIADWLYVTPSTLRIVWHLLTPLNIPTTGPNPFGWEYGAENETDKVWGALGHPTDGYNIPWMVSHLSYLFERSTLAFRHKFWTEEITGDVEL